MSTVLKLLGQKFGRLQVIERLGNDRWKKARWLCRCTCGKSVIANSGDLLTGNTKSCGCLRADNTAALKYRHGLRWTHSYNSWNDMLRRCGDSAHRVFKHYGGRGIKVCERWLEFTNFFKDMGERPKRYTLERKDNEGNYTPGNCCWATQKQQARNKRTNKNYATKR